ncbi:type VI secretion system tip protein VgrG, partial [Escherichia sp. E13S3]
LSKNGIEHGSSGEFIMKTSNYLVPGSGANLPNETPNFSLTDITQESKISSKSFND